MTTRKHVFYGILALVSLLGLGITQSAKANYIVTLEKVGHDVVAIGSGAIDLTGLTFLLSSVSFGGGRIVANQGFIVTTGPTASVNYDDYSGVTGPTSFGSRGLFFANSGSGDFVGISGLTGEILVPQGYVSGAALSDSMTFNHANLAGLGLTPGSTYEWTWGAGANQTFTLQIGPGIVPDFGSTLPLLGFALLGVAMLRRKLRC